MKFTRLTPLWAFIIMLLNACTQENGAYTPPSGGQVRIHAAIQPAEGNSRADLNAEGYGTFSKGDRIGLYIRSYTENKTRYLILTYDGSDWQPRLRPEQIWHDGRHVSVSAFYPADENTPAEQEGITDRFTFEIPSDQQQETSFRQADRLYATEKYLPPYATDISLDFSHAMLRIDLDLSGVITQNPDVKILSGQKGYAYVDAEKTLFGGRETDFAWFSPLQDKDNPSHYSVITFPMVDDYNGFDEKIQVRLTSEQGKEVTYSVPALQLSQARPGTRLRINLTSSGEGITDTRYAGKKIWFHGITAPVYPESPWLTLGEGYPEVLPYSDSYGWFDANKRNKFAPIHDVYHCWAAVASNMIHWWLHQNEPYASEYIAWYNKQHPDAPLPDCRFQPLTKDDSGTLHGGSGIFAYFTERFVDSEGYASEGVDWFFNGNLPRTPANIRSGGGFFKGVITGKPAFYELGITKKRFNELIKKAIENKQIAAYSANAHVQTIWGVEFDEEGTVKYIYNADNNYAENDLKFGGAMVTRIRIGYTDHSTLVNYRPGPPATGSVITALHFMKLNEGALKAFVEQHCR